MPNRRMEGSRRPAGFRWRVVTGGAMRRLHLVEFHDLRWFPSAWRNALTADLGTDGYSWQVGRVHSVGAFRITYLLGIPERFPRNHRTPTRPL